MGIKYFQWLAINLLNNNHQYLGIELLLVLYWYVYFVEKMINFYPKCFEFIT